jgi:predicted dehydrogenase
MTGGRDPRPLRVVVVGCGDIATTGHLPAIQRSPEVELVGVLDVVREHREAAADRYGVPAWTDLRAAVEAGAEAAVVAVPPHVAPQLTVRAVRSGLDVLCEKPMAVDLADALEVQRIVAGTDRIVQIGFKNRFSPLVRVVRDWLRAGRIGTPVVYTLGGFDERLDPRDTVHVGRIQAFLDRGPSFLHEGAHRADHLAFLSGASPVSVHAAGVRSMEEFGSENFASALVRYDSGDLARLEVGWFFPENPVGEFRVLGPRGTALVDRPGGVTTLTERLDGGELATEVVRLERPWNDECFDRQLEHFVACVRTRAEPETSVAAGVASLRLGCAVVESMRTGEVVRC